jgi:hypothetical protein
VGRIMLRSFGFRHSARAGGLSTSAIFFDCRPHTRLLCFLGSGLALLWVSPYSRFLLIALRRTSPRLPARRGSTRELNVAITYGLLERRLDDGASSPVIIHVFDVTD